MFIRKVRFNWHRIWIGFYSLLLEDCICEREQERLKNKIDDHNKEIMNMLFINI